ncbi:50S ribosomal protein L22 [candidate division TA06 bacterium DG_24]|jgi:large subunit ribosomal protein L22|uniref:Large ribosomal subunit protein uL22 n=3 Tax=Bacteria division TA06 TaxID=1156500 RepID=A0A0S8JIL8_UNCT6|nr:MAG: 50S ribosomal protein L22 [candidate division TA06 bacterium DG_24]KPK70909.1 MAG: 50S ribosomal protein L22 [candidate division TA06 bacterium SM23_40]KPL09583.1 MAG: 50S ribosomal protein L22 [candidate division TA06 bacterium SM1_40]
MEARARARYVRLSPRKIGRVIDLVRGKGVGEALQLLKFLPKRAAVPVEKTIRSAVANAVHNTEGRRIDPDQLWIKEIRVDGGATMKRWRARAMGRANLIRKRTSHITVVVSEQEGEGEES